MASAPIKYARFRKPSFLIVGAQKCGTSSLYHNLVQHPHVQPARKKEIHFFDANYEKGMDWYCRFFPPTGLFQGIISGEASPSYFFLPLVPERVRDAFPDIKLILLLRNPVDRAYSQYQHNVRNHHLTGSFEQALKRAERLDAAQDKSSFRDPVFIEKLRRTGYLARGKYIHQLERWLAFFPLDQFLIIKSEDFFEYPAKTMDTVLAFLGLDAYLQTDFSKKNSYDYPAMSLAIRRDLTDYFRPFNRRLYDLLGVNYHWGGKGK